MTSNFDAACAWARKGYNVVPRKSVDKKYPGVKWKEYQTQRTDNELARWQKMFVNGVGFITGEISNAIVIETDGLMGQTVLDLFEKEHGPLPETLVIRSGSHRGFHYHFKHPGSPVKTVANPLIQVDVRGDGGFCVLPPSLHKSGGAYEIAHDAEPAELPKHLLEFIAAAETNAAAEAAQKTRKQNKCASVDPNPLVFDEARAFKKAAGVEPNILADSKKPLSVTDMAEMLTFLVEKNFFEHRDKVVCDANNHIIKIGWRECGMALKPAYGDDDGLALWAITHIDEQARDDAPDQWASFADQARPGDVTMGTIIKAAKDAGFELNKTVIAVTEPGYVSHGSFTMDADDGLTSETLQGQGKNKQLATDWISAPFEILGACRDPQGRAWGKQLRFSDADGRVHTRHIADADLHGDPSILCRTLADEGLKISRKHQKPFADYLSSVRIDKRVTVVGRTGWHEINGQLVFALPDQTISSGSGDPVMLDPTARGPYEVLGSIEDWKQGVGTLTSGHTLPVFMVSAALAGPLAYLVGAEGGGVHVFGTSSIGKSATLQVAASVWGKGSTPGYVRSWRATANGLEGAAASATDTCLVLDEIGVGDARNVAESVYSLANGVGKARASRDGSAREPSSWRVFVLSSGELPVETKINEDRNRKSRAGQMVRLLDIPADRGLEHGAFNSTGGFDDAGKLADALKHAAGATYGTAGPEFVARLMKGGLEKLPATAKAFIARFIHTVVEQNASEQIRRAAKKFALIALAGELATKLGVTPWVQLEAWHAAIWAFERWVEKRGGTGSHEDSQAIAQVRLIIEHHGETRFDNLDGLPIDVRDRLGWRKGEDVAREWFVPKEIWKTVFCDGLDPSLVARTLYAKGMLRRQDAKHLTCVVAINKTPLRVYVLTAKILDG